MIAHVRSKGWKRKGEEERNTTSYANSIQVSEETWESTHSEKRKKERKPQAMGKKKAIHAHFQRKKRKGGHQLRKVVQVRPAGGMYPEQKIAGRNCTKVLGVSSGLTTWDRPVL